MTTKLRRYTEYIARFIQLQLFLSIVSLPILVAWGLPLSMMTAVGNFVFGPFLAVFLLCSSFIFFTELLGIPNGALIILLEKITAVWTYCLSFGSKSWLIGFYQPSCIILIITTIAAFLIMHHKKWGRLYPSIGALSVLLCITIGYLLSTKPHDYFCSIACDKEQITLMVKNGNVLLKDNGAFAKKRSPDSWVQYTLLPTITKQTGATSIKTVTVTTAHTFTFEALVALCEHGNVSTIELPYFNNELTPAGWHSFFKLQRTAADHNVKIRRISLQTTE